MLGTRGAPPTVLVVDDEALVAMLVADTLTEAGYRVVCAPDGRTASPGYSAWTLPDAVVVDLRLANGLDGRDILRWLRKRQPNLPALVITGYGPFAPEANLRGLGGPTGRLGKPFDRDEFLASLVNLLARPAARLAPSRRFSDVAA